MRHVHTTTYLRVPAARMAAAGVRRTGAQRLRKRIARAAFVRVPVDFADDAVPEAPSGVVRVSVTVGVHTRARNGRQALARLLGLEPRIDWCAVVAVCAANLECCIQFHTPPRGCLRLSANTRSTARAHAARPCWPCSEDERQAAAPPGGLSVGGGALVPATAVEFTGQSCRRNEPQRGSARLPTCDVAGRSVRVRV
jgi:hypothetical protein